MKNLRTLTDKVAIGLSTVCLIHCLIFPFLLVLVPAFSALQLEHSDFHIWMIAVVIPTSAYALTLGCKRHRDYSILALGVGGVSFLIAAVVVGEAFHLHGSERIFTSIGALMIAVGHYENFRLCQQLDNCECSDETELNEG